MDVKKVMHYFQVDIYCLYSSYSVCVFNKTKSYNNYNVASLV